MEKSSTPSAIRKRKWRQENPERYLKSNRENTWKILGIDVDYANYLREIHSKCEICEEPSKLCVDHDHNSNSIRGVLCKRCNSGLGLFRDNSTFLRKAATYLEASRHD